ncbi:MAG: hypothetical protein V4556_11480 [Bacteroidota bacterium]
MPQKNILLFTHFKNKDIPTFLYKSRFVIAITSAVLLLLSSCVKSPSDYSSEELAKLFETNILNRTFIVDLASDNGTNLTADYTGYNFVLTKTTSYYDGPITGTKGSLVYNGTWGCNEDFSKLTINLIEPSIPAEFVFLNRSWKFTDKTFPVLELAPWGSTAPKILHMKRL